MILLLLSLLLCFLYLIFIGRAVSGWSTYQKTYHKDAHTLPSITILIPFRNEEKNIPALLESLLAQPLKGKDQVLFINDHSTDKSVQMLEEGLAGNKHCHILHQTPEKNGKKRAIELGIEKCLNQWILTTDADCTFPNHWLSQWKLELKHTDKQFLIGPVGLTYENNLITKFQALEFAGLMSLAAGNLAKEKVQTCSGANLCYRKSLFNEVNGFEGNLNYASGDDEFLLHKAFTAHPEYVGFAYNSNLLVKAKSLNRFSEFFAQRLRWASKGGAYTIKRLQWEQYFIGVYMLWFWLMFTLSFLSVEGAQTACGFIFFTKLLMDYVLLSKTSYFFKVNEIIGYLPLSQIIQYIYIPLVGVASFFGKGRWKGRKI